MNLRSIAAVVLLPALALPVHAGMLYKAVDANGTILFSDVPPPDGARLVEQRVIASGPPDSPVLPLEPATLGEAFELVDYDAEFARANARVDQAEHALALARRPVWSPRDGLDLTPTRMSRTDGERVEFFKRDLEAARQGLIELLRSRQLASR